MKAFITGVCGMDGSHLADLLLLQGYEVHGLVRRASGPNYGRIAHIRDSLKLHTGDLLDQTSLEEALKQAQPDEIYNLAAQSFVGSSFQVPVYTADATGLGALRLYEAVRRVCPKAKVYQASSSEMFGNSPSLKQYWPASPYACAKLFAHHMADVYRESYKLDIRCAINYNHEGERRGSEFVTRKITQAVAKARVEGWKGPLQLGDLSPIRDWSYAPVVMRIAWEIMQEPEGRPVTVVCSGEGHSVREFLNEAVAYAQVGSILEIQESDEFKRPYEVNRLVGVPDIDSGEVPFAEIIHRMVDHDIETQRYSAR